MHDPCVDNLNARADGPVDALATAEVLCHRFRDPLQTVQPAEPTINLA
jgi:hypothetical protein